MDQVTLAQAATKFHAYILTERRAQANTVAAYCRDIEQLTEFLRPYALAIDQVTHDHIKQFLQAIKSQGLGARSMARKISAIKLFFSYLYAQGLCDNLAEQLTAPKIDKTLPRFLTEEEIASLLAATDADTSSMGKRNQAILYVLYGTGMRISELVTLKVSHVHWESNMLSVDGKGGKERMIPVPGPVMDLLREYMDTTRRAYLASHGVQDDPYVFSAYYGGCCKPLTRQACWNLLKMVWKKTGNKKNISPHQLRHSLATHLLKQGADLRSLQLILGHENLATVQIYTHVEMSHLRSVYDKKHPRSK